MKDARPKAIPLALALLAANLILFIAVDEAQAVASTTSYTTAFGELGSAARDIVQQTVQTMNPNGVSCGGVQSGSPSLTSGTRYYVALGGSSVSNLSVFVGGVLAFSLSTSTQSVTYARSEWQAELMWVETDNSANAVYSMGFTPGTSGTMQLTCTPANAYARFEPGSSPPSLGLVGTVLHAGSSIIAAIYTADATPISEAGILSGCTNCPEATKSPVPTQFTWTRIAGGESIANGTGTPSVALKQLEMAQSFTPNTAIGKYLSRTAWRIEGLSNVACTATLSVSVADTLQHPWSPSSEHANITASVSKPTSGQAITLSVDWTAGTITSNSIGLAVGSSTMSIHGQAVSTPAMLPPFTLEGGSGPHYVRTKIWGGTCTLSELTAAEETTTSTYSGGALWTNDGTGWTERPAADMYQLDFQVYGGTTIAYSASGQRNMGGASYIYICEVEMDTAQQKYTFTSSFGGSGRKTSFNAFGNNICAGAATSGQHNVQEWRLGYNAIPLNDSFARSITLDTVGSGRNLLYAGRLAGTQPAQPHVATTAYSPSSGASLLTYALLSTDDYFVQLAITVRDCADDQCSTFGNLTTEASWTATVCDGGTYPRVLSDIVGGDGFFLITGQDVIGCTTRITITGQNYTAITWTKVIPTAGSYVFTIGAMPKAITLGTFLLDLNSVTFSGISCEPNPGNFTAPARANITASVVPADTYYAIFVAQSGGQPTIISEVYPSPGSGNAQFYIYWPIGRNSTAEPFSDEGSYVIMFTDKAGNPLRACAFIIWDGTGAAPQPQATNDPTLLGIMARAMQTTVTEYELREATQTQQERAVDYILLATEFGFATWFLIPNHYWLLVLTAAAGMFMFDARRK